MFKILIGLEVFKCVDSLTEACQQFIKEVQRLISAGQISEMMLYETCTIDARFGSRNYTMNFDAITSFSRAAGILSREGKLIDRPAPYMHKDIEREVFIHAHLQSLATYLEEQAEMLATLPESAPTPTEPTIVIASK